jgi:hypothetical protein
MRRRKLSVSVLDARWHRKQLSVDVHLPAPLLEWARANRLESLPVPITMLFKAPEVSMDFDLRDGAGSTVSLPLLKENLAVSREVLLALAELCGREAGRPRLHESEPVVALAKAVAIADRRASAIDVTRVLRGYPQKLDAALLEHPRFMWLAERLSEKSLIVLDLPLSRNGSIVKLSFLDRNDRDHDPGEHGDDAQSIVGWQLNAGWQPFKLRVIADAWPCGSFHFEAEAPEDLEILDADIVEYLAPATSGGQPVKERRGVPMASTRPDPVDTSNRVERTHLYLGNLPGAAAWNATVIRFRATRGSFISGATYITLLVAVLLTWTTVEPFVMCNDLDAGAAVLLAAAALTATAVSQSTKHRLAARMLTVVRRAVLVSSGLLIAALLWLLLLHQQSEARRGFWTNEIWVRVPLAACALIGIQCFLIAYLARLLPSAGKEPFLAKFRWPLTPFAKQLGTRSIVDLR